LKRPAKFRDAMADMEARIARLEANRGEVGFARLAAELDAIVAAAKDRARAGGDKALIDEDAEFSRELKRIENVCRR
jgi:hypothetical protein